MPRVMIPPNENTTGAPEKVRETPPQRKLVYTMREAAEALDVSYMTVHRLLKRGLLRGSSALRIKRIPVAELERFLNATLQ